MSCGFRSYSILSPMVHYFQPTKTTSRDIFECPQMWVWPQVPLGGPPPPPPCALGPLPPTSLGRPLPEPCKKGQGRAGREGVWLEGRVLQLQSGMEGALQTPAVARPTSGGSQYMPLAGSPRFGGLKRWHCKRRRKISGTKQSTSPNF